MKNCAVLLFAVLLAVGTASAQTPDPTGRGRYVQFGQEVSYQEARVVTQLPPGATCAPAGELVGIRLWNSTREGYAIASELTPTARVAVAPDGRIFLCDCVAGFNELFHPAEATVEVSTPAALANSPDGVVVNNNITVNVPVTREGWQKAADEVTKPPKPIPWSTEKKVTVGIVVVVVVAILVVVAKDGGGNSRGKGGTL